ncbi:MAG: LuxR C-terminal-related transcriptional regulator [Chitinophagaceae bacterium]|jgi:DNA-binding CsgD family transcriptional regulator|nr:LuxR C-terminal-related transcriptional regulator [Chitinophagaceae bacterium]
MEKNNILANALLDELEFINPVYTVKEFKEIIVRDDQQGGIDVTATFGDKIKHLPTYAVGRYMWYAVDRLSLVCSGGMVEHFVGKSAEQWYNKTPEEYFEIVDPEDRPYIMGYAKLIYEFLVAVPVGQKEFIRPYMCFRLLIPGTQHSRWVLFYYIDWVYASDGRIAGILHAIYDISHIKNSGMPTMTILDLREETNQLWFSHAPTVIDRALQRMQVCKITERERQILRLLMQGLPSKQIADKLSISKNTVENYRQNLLKKTNTGNSNEMVAYALQHGLI